jgi:hypothetical protein
VARETRDEIGQQGALARLILAEEMAAASDVEQQPGIAAEAAGAAGIDFSISVGLGDRGPQRIDRDPGRVAVASISVRSACGSTLVVTRSGTSARASARRMCTLRPAARACGLSAARRGQPSSQTTVAAALTRQSWADQSLAVRASRSGTSLGNHREMMRFIVPLHEP